MGRRVAIVGRGPTAPHAPFHDFSWDIWGLGWVKYPREDLTFDPHGPGCRSCPEYADYKATADAKGIPILCVADGFYKYEIPYPFQLIFEEFGSYLESSIAYMMAYAIWFGDVEEIGLWGVHLNTESEYNEQRENLAYWIGFARAKGIKVTISPGSPVLMSYWVAGRYGVNENHR